MTEKERIISELFKSNLLHHQIIKMCDKNHIKRDSLIHEDVIAETFYHVSKIPDEKIIDLDQQQKLLNYACCIAIRKGFLKDPNNPGYHKHSVARNILYGSNFTESNEINETAELEDEHNLLFEFIREHLTEEENNFLNHILYDKKKRGRFKSEIKMKKDLLFEKIKMIIK